MMIILFRPFDPVKWFAIGLSAFLAGMLGGGNGVNTSFNGNFRNNQFPTSTNISPGNASKVQLDQIHTQLSHFFSSMTGLLIAVIVVGVILFIMVLSLLFCWLGARGQFLFLDNIVRNRGAISWPWQYYARQANSFFLFYLLLVVGVLVVTLPILAVAAVLAIPLFKAGQWPAGGEIAVFVVLGLLYFVVAVAGNVVLFLYREFGPAIMFRQGILARAAFFETVRLVRRFPGSVAVYILLRMALFLAMAVLCIILCCATFCLCFLSQWPYIGTVLLLPVLVYLRCFTLDCLAQFGPQYDVFTVDVPPTPTAQV